MNIEQAKICETCKGAGEYKTMDRVYNDDPAIMAPVGTETCSNCLGSGVEPDDEIVVERVLNNLSDEQEEKLQTYFMENDGAGYVKDQIEDAFDGWISNLNLADLIEILK